MNRADIKELHFITHIANIESIMRHGIVSRNLAKKKMLSFSDISEEGVQDRRSGKRFRARIKYCMIMLIYILTPTILC